ncbi:hypothetical protein JCM11641_001809, partial [Rhodosporidiobolus odoratus]
VKPSSAATLPKLTKGNFRTWLHRVRIYAGASGRKQAYEGTAVRAQRTGESEEKYQLRVDEHERADLWLQNIIYGSIDEVNAAVIEGATTAKECLDRLTKYHGATKYASVFTLLKELFDTRLVAGGDVNEHLARLRRLQNGLADYGKGTSSSTSTLDLSLPDPLFAAIILFSLPSSFNTLRTNVFADPEGKLDTASIYALIANDAATNTVDTITSG